jgi:hypothetical protein
VVLNLPVRTRKTENKEIANEKYHSSIPFDSKDTFKAKFLFKVHDIKVLSKDYQILVPNENLDHEESIDEALEV